MISLFDLASVSGGEATLLSGNTSIRVAIRPKDKIRQDESKGVVLRCVFTPQDTSALWRQWDEGRTNAEQALGSGMQLSSHGWRFRSRFIGNPDKAERCRREYTDLTSDEQLDDGHQEDRQDIASEDMANGAIGETAPVTESATDSDTSPQSTPVPEPFNEYRECLRINDLVIWGEPVPGDLAARVCAQGRLDEVCIWDRLHNRPSKT